MMMMMMMMMCTQTRLQNVLQTLLHHKLLVHRGRSTDADTLPDDATLTLNLHYQKSANQR